MYNVIVAKKLSRSMVLLYFKLFGITVEVEGGRVRRGRERRKRTKEEEYRTPASDTLNPEKLAHVCMQNEGNCSI